LVVHGERVLAASRLVDRLLGDHGPQDDVGGGQDAHAYTSSMRARAGCSIRTASALSRSTTLSESARITITDGRFEAERSSDSSGAGATTRPRRAWPSPAPSASRTATNALVFGSSVIPNWSTTRIASSPNFAVSAERRAIRRILRGSFCS